MVHGVFISPEPCRFQRRKGPKSSLLLVTLMEDKYSLHIINEIISMVDPLRDLLYTYEFREIITLDMNYSYNYSR
jgi:hypothetical protein